MSQPPSLTPLRPPVYFLSDVHLGAALVPDPRLQQDHLISLLQRVAADGRTLVLAGDIFDFWYEWAHVIPKQPFDVLWRLRNLTAAGVAVHYLAGNHDFRLHGFLERTMGMQVHADALTAGINGQTVHIFHGDGVLPRDRGYRLLKRVLRSPVAQRLFLWLHPDLGMGLARSTSKTSRAMDHSGSEDDEHYLTYAQARFAEGCDGVVMGHTHRPVEHTEGHRVYVNLGDWITHFTYGLHDGTRLRLRRLHD